MGYMFRLIAKLVATIVLLISLGSFYIKEALNQVTQGTMNWWSVIPYAIKGGIQNGFYETRQFIFNFSEFMALRQGGEITFGLFKIAVLLLFFYLLVYLIWDIATGPEINPWWQSLLCALGVVFFGSLFFGTTNQIIVNNITNITNSSEVIFHAV